MYMHCVYLVLSEMIHVNPIQYLKKLQIFIMAYAIMHIANCTNTNILTEWNFNSLLYFLYYIGPVVHCVRYTKMELLLFSY